VRCSATELVGLLFPCGRPCPTFGAEFQSVLQLVVRSDPGRGSSLPVANLQCCDGVVGRNVAARWFSSGLPRCSSMEFELARTLCPFFSLLLHLVWWVYAAIYNPLWLPLLLLM
jgi:hypothetical protein